MYFTCAKERAAEGGLHLCVGITMKFTNNTNKFASVTLAIACLLFVVVVLTYL